MAASPSSKDWSEIQINFVLIRLKGAISFSFFPLITSHVFFDLLFFLFSIRFSFIVFGACVCIYN